MLSAALSICSPKVEAALSSSFPARSAGPSFSWHPAMASNSGRTTNEAMNLRDCIAVTLDEMVRKEWSDHTPAHAGARPFRKHDAPVVRVSNYPAAPPSPGGECRTDENHPDDVGAPRPH